MNVSDAKELGRICRANGPVEDIIVRFLAYQDAPLDADKKKRHLTDTLSLGGAHKYAEGVRSMIRLHSAEAVVALVDNIHGACLSSLASIGLYPSAYSQSRSWAYWDLGKQFHFAGHPEDPCPGYTRADPVTQEAKLQEIIDRHIGWEVFSWREALPEPLRQRASDPVLLDLLARPPKAQEPGKGTLSSAELTQLGRAVRRVMGIAEMVVRN